MRSSRLSAPWYELQFAGRLPLAVRVWRWWLMHAPRRRAGGVWAGSAIFRMLRPSIPNRAVLLDCPGRPSIAIHPRDVECFIHTVPLWVQGSGEETLLGALAVTDAVFVDVGANYGLYTLAAASMGMRVVAFEPQPSVAATLRLSASANRFDVRIEEACVGPVTGEAVLHVALRGSGTASLDRAHTARQGRLAVLRVRQWAIDDLVLPRVDVMKIDVEGMEPGVIAGSRETLTRHAPIVWYEANRDETASALRALGYDAFFDVETLLAPVGRSVNIVAVHPRRRAEFEAARARCFAAGH